MSPSGVDAGLCAYENAAIPSCDTGSEFSQGAVVTIAAPRIPTGLPKGPAHIPPAPS